MTANESRAESEPAVSKSKAMSFFSLLVALVLAATVAIFFMVRLHSSARWPQVRGSVAESEVAEATSRRGGALRVSYEVQLRYDYSVQGENYSGDRIMIALPNVFPTEERAKEVADRFPAGSEVDVYFNPSRPGKACLIPGSIFPLKAYIAMAALIVVVVAIIAAISMIDLQEAFERLSRS